MRDTHQTLMAQRWHWFITIVLTPIAFAANSIFCRLALRDSLIYPESFTAIRLLGGWIFSCCTPDSGPAANRGR
ncbi:hypothetical protein ACXM5X_30280 [Pseudomonas saponiphila]